MFTNNIHCRIMVFVSKRFPYLELLNNCSLNYSKNNKTILFEIDDNS